MNPLELAIVSQLVLGDQRLSRQLNSVCSSLCQRTDRAVRATAECSDDVKDSDDDPKPAENQAFQTALLNAASAYRELLEWSSRQRCTEEGSTSCVGIQLREICRRLGYLGDSSNAEPLIPKAPRKPVKVFCDGVFDLVHAGHFNALRQAAQLGDELYVGLSSDDEALQAKGVLPVLSTEERASIVGACKWVTGVMLNAPYDVDLKFFATTGCDFVAHGDDIALNSQGVDCYAEVRAAGFLKQFKRTEGISTTSIIAELLAEEEEGHTPATSRSFDSSGQTPSTATSSDSGGGSDSSPTIRDTVTSCKRLAQFMGRPKSPLPNDKVVYIGGSFNIFHPGHLHIFEKARAMGDFLLVGVYDDETVRKLKGARFPVQPMLHRVLSLMAIRHVDEVLMGAPDEIDENFIKSFKIDVVVHGCRSDVSDSPRRLGMSKLKGLCEVAVVESGSTLTTRTLVERIKQNRQKLRHSIAQRQVKEQNFYSDLTRIRCDEL